RACYEEGRGGIPPRWREAEHIAQVGGLLAILLVWRLGIPLPGWFCPQGPSALRPQTRSPCLHEPPRDGCAGSLHPEKQALEWVRSCSSARRYPFGRGSHFADNCHNRDPS